MDPKDKTIKELNEKIKRLEKELIHAKRYEEAIDAAGFDIFENNFVTGETHNTNKRLFESLGYSEEEIPKDVDNTFAKAHKDDMARALEKVAANISGETKRYHAEIRMKAKDGSWIWIGNYGRVYERNEAGGVTRFIGVTFNIDERRIKEETMKELAYKESLTGLSNRRVLYETGKLEMDRAKRYDHPLSLMIFDVDNFKYINDTYGHPSGDIILQKIAKIICDIVRESDLKIRYGGDEFIIMLLETNEQKAFETCERLRKKIKDHHFLIKENITISIGVTQMLASDSVDTLIEKADLAMYEAKSAGRNRTIVYSKPD